MRAFVGLSGQFLAMDLITLSLITLGLITLSLITLGLITKRPITMRSRFSNVLRNGLTWHIARDAI